MHTLSESWWRSKGFSQCPTLSEAKGDEVIYRVCGGPTSLVYGSCYSFVKPTTVSAAEFNSNIVKWGNRCYYFVSFRVHKGVPLYIGPIDQSYERKDQDDGQDVFIWGSAKAQQIWIDPKRAMASLTLLNLPQPLRQDVSVVIPRQRHDV